MKEHCQAYSLPVTNIIALLLASAVAAQAVELSRGYAFMLDALLKKSVPLISTSVLKDLMETEKIYLLDVRTQDEFRVSRIKNARLTVFKSFSVNDLGDIPRDATVVLYCSVGYRSEKAGEKLVSAGYSKVFNLHGGIFQWINDGYPVYNNKGITKKVHGYSLLWSRWLEKGTVVFGADKDQ